MTTLNIYPSFANPLDAAYHLKDHDAASVVKASDEMYRRILCKFLPSMEIISVHEWSLFIYGWWDSLLECSISSDLYFSTIKDVRNDMMRHDYESRLPFSHVHLSLPN